MRMTIGLILLLLGTAIVLYGVGDALLDLVGLYQSALEDPLGAPDEQEQTVSRDMIRAVIVGAVGVPPMLVGSYLFFGGLRRTRRLRRRYARSAPGAGGW